MSILAGGVWCAGAFQNSMRTDSAFNFESTTTLNQYICLSPDPLNRAYNSLRAYCAQGLYAQYGTDEAKRAEVKALSTVEKWGTTYTHYWRIVIPPDWKSYGASTYGVVAQCHDVNGAGVGRRPTLAAEIRNSTLYWVLSLTSNPAGIDLYSVPITPGMELEFTVKVKWADGTNIPASEGTLELFHNDSLVYSRYGQKNTWDGTPVTEPNPPYIKAGIYQPLTDETWWIGRQMEIWHVATIVATADETPSSLRSWVNGQLAVNNNFAKAPFVPEV